MVCILRFRWLGNKTLKCMQLFISDSEDLYTYAFTKVCAQYGKEFTWEMKASLLGFQGQECANKIIRELNIPLTENEFMQECNKIYEAVFPNVKLMPGTEHILFPSMYYSISKFTSVKILYDLCMYMHYNFMQKNLF